MRSRGLERDSISTGAALQKESDVQPIKRTLIHPARPLLSRKPLATTKAAIYRCGCRWTARRSCCQACQRPHTRGAARQRQRQEDNVPGRVAEASIISCPFASFQPTTAPGLHVHVKPAPYPNAPAQSIVRATLQSDNFLLPATTTPRAIVTYYIANPRATSRPATLHLLQRSSIES